MNQDSHVMLITQTLVKSDKKDAFEQWQQKMEATLKKFPGYLKCDLQKPNPPVNLKWIVIYYFDTMDATKAWLQSATRKALVEEAIPYSMGVDNLYIMQGDQPDKKTASAAITSKVAKDAEQKFLEWQAQISLVQSKFDGFIGCKVERPRQGSDNDDWVALVTFDSDEHLDKWLNSSERTKLLADLKKFTSGGRIEKLHSDTELGLDNSDQNKQLDDTLTQDSHVMLFMQTRVKPDKNNDFEQWQQKVVTTLKTFPGYLKCDLQKPNPPLNLDWVIIYYFTTVGAARSWLQSPARRDLTKEATTYSMGIDNLYLKQGDHSEQSNATASIVTKVAKGAEQKFIDWQSSIAPLQSQFDGFIGCKVESPRQGSDNDDWVTLITFDSETHLDQWLHSSERSQMLTELKDFTSNSRIQKLRGGFGFWFNKAGTDSDNDEQVWKNNMLVLLALYPTVFLISFIQTPIVNAGVPFWFALFFGNALSTVLLGSIAVPWLMDYFNWWLILKPDAAFRNGLGVSIVVLLYLVSMLGCWSLHTLLQ